MLTLVDTIGTTKYPHFPKRLPQNEQSLTQMFSNDTERKVFIGILAVVLSLAVIIGAACCVMHVRDRDRLRNNTPTNTNETANQTTLTWWPFERPPAEDIEMPKLKISLPAGFRPLHLVEQQEVESSEKRTVAQAQRNAMESALFRDVSCQ